VSKKGLELQHLCYWAVFSQMTWHGQGTSPPWSVPHPCTLTRRHAAGRVYSSSDGSGSYSRVDVFNSLTCGVGLGMGGWVAGQHVEQLGVCRGCSRSSASAGLHLCLYSGAGVDGPTPCLATQCQVLEPAGHLAGVAPWQVCCHACAAARSWGVDMGCTHRPDGRYGAGMVHGS
jgi:hypothetical protein